MLKIGYAARMTNVMKIHLFRPNKNDIFNHMNYVMFSTIESCFEKLELVLVSIHLFYEKENL